MTCHVYGHLVAVAQHVGPWTLIPKEKQQKGLYNDLPFYTVRILRSSHTEQRYNHVPAKEVRCWKMRLSWGEQVATVRGWELVRDLGHLKLLLSGWWPHSVESGLEIWAGACTCQWPQAILTSQILFTYKTALISILEHCVENNRKDSS